MSAVPRCQNKKIVVVRPGVLDYFSFLCFNFDMDMRILVDIDIIIGLEDNRVVEKNFSDFFRYATSNQCRIFYLPDCRETINRDGDIERREITLSKISKYSELPNPAGTTGAFNKKIGNNSEGDTLENKQLFQLYSEYVELFVTENERILAKARIVECRDKVLSITEALNVLREKFEYTVPQHPILKSCKVRDIKDRIAEPFFDSLRADYPEFNEWFGRCVKQNRDCYYLTVEGKISALLIYNIETVEQHQIPGVFEKAVKMCTFKTDENAFGLKMGELFLNKMFQFCVEQNINYLYLTLFDKHKFLVGLLTRFGFSKSEFQNNRHEIIMIKKLERIIAPGKVNNIIFHPFYSDAPTINKYVIPIRQNYYDSLFKDSSIREKTLFDTDKVSLNEIQGNSIVKAYICRARAGKLKPGDILLFYSSRKLKLIQPVGILDKAHSIEDLNKLISVVRGKTVYSEKQLENIFNEKPSSPVLVLIFRLIYYLKKPIELKTLKTLNCFSNKFITITKMPEHDYSYLKEEDFFDERYIID